MDLKGLKFAVGTGIISIAMSRCIVVKEENLVVWEKALLGMHHGILESLGSYVTYLGVMVHQTRSGAYSHNNGYISTSLLAYLSVGPLSYCCYRGL